MQSIALATVRARGHNSSMNETEKRFRVTAELTSIYQIVIQATSPEEAEEFAMDIDLDKWIYIQGEYQVVDVAKDYFERKQKVEQDTEVSPSNEGPTLKIVKG
jgi:hypothetical protein